MFNNRVILYVQVKVYSTWKNEHDSKRKILKRKAEITIMEKTG